jgi:hypothetical protein
MNDPDNRKSYRRENIEQKHFKKNKISEEQRLQMKSKKEKKEKVDLLREEELWQDWEEYN